MKTYKELKESTKINTGDHVDFHNDLGKMVSGVVKSISKGMVTIEVNGVKFKRKDSEVHSGGK